MKMKYLIGFVALLIINSCGNTNVEKEPINEKENHEVSFYTSDSVKIYGEFLKVGKEATTIMLFHQAGSNAKGEYDSIAKVLYKKGYNVLAIDQRSGGQLYGSYNRTIAGFKANSYTYCDVYSDMEATIDFLIIEGFNGHKIAWGSSYSAALVIRLAANRPKDVQGVLAFSPASGSPMEGCRPESSFGSIKVPLLILRPDREAEYESVKTQLELAQKHGFKTYISENGVHGSSMLVDSRTKSSTQKTWYIVNEFNSNL